MLTMFLTILALVLFLVAVFPQGRGQIHCGWAGAFVLALVLLVIPKL